MGEVAESAEVQSKQMKRALHRLGVVSTVSPPIVGHTAFRKHYCSSALPLTPSLIYWKMPRRVLIADDSRAIRRAVRSWLESKTDYEICGEAEDGRTAVHLVERLKPDAVILDLAMPVMNGLQAADKIIAKAPNTEIVVLTNFPSDLLKQHALRIGIKAVLAKDGENTLDRLLSTLQSLPNVP